jgi:aspartyl-tRNA(Asn)/glutamyl-tRNA(Gln) amidotransferase subunit A
MLHTLSLRELAAELRARRLSSRELTRHYLDRIAAHDPRTR